VREDRINESLRIPEVPRRCSEARFGPGSSPSPSNAAGFRASARSLVAWSDNGRLLEIFRDLPIAKAYVYGEWSANPAVLAHLEAIPPVRLADCGHFVLAARPTELACIELARIVGEVILRS